MENTEEQHETAKKKASGHWRSFYNSAPGDLNYSNRNFRFYSKDLTGPKTLEKSIYQKLFEQDKISHEDTYHLQASLQSQELLDVTEAEFQKAAILESVEQLEAILENGYQQLENIVTFMSAHQDICGNIRALKKSVEGLMRRRGMESEGDKDWAYYSDCELLYRRRFDSRQQYSFYKKEENINMPLGDKSDVAARNLARMAKEKDI